MRRICFLILLLCALSAAAEVGFVSVTSQDAHTKKEDFFHTFEYYILSPEGRTSKCQATRVGKKWFATAAHCVADACAKGCTVRMDLLEQTVSVLSETKHTLQKPSVFIHPSYNPKVSVKYDFALIRLDLNTAPATYYYRGQSEQEPNIRVSRAAFERYLQTHPSARREFKAVISPALPPVLVFDNATRRIDRDLSVISIFDGKRNILHNPNPTDYVKELGFAYTRNFGVRKGMSGSGVMTNTGELAGVISAYLGVTSPQSNKEYFMFVVFNKDLMDFMESVMGSDYYKMERVDAYPNYVSKTRADHQDIIQGVRAVNKRTTKSAQK